MRTSRHSRRSAFRRRGVLLIGLAVLARLPPTAAGAWPVPVADGMNPGPWGMAQTGVPFGDVIIVRDWLGASNVIWGRDLGIMQRFLASPTPCAALVLGKAPRQNKLINLGRTILKVRILRSRAAPRRR